jgi:proteasome lid subunit RPN8/RPN11
MVQLTAEHRQQMFQHALDGRPNEACGLLGGRNGRVARVYPAANKENSPVRYEIEPRDLIRIFRDIEDNDLELVGIYHSHVFTEAYPSATDIRLAYYPEALYFLVSLMDESRPALRAFRIVDGTITEEAIEIVGD